MNTAKYMKPVYLKRRIKVKVKFTVEQATKAQSGR